MKNNYIYNILKNIYLKNPLSTAIEIEDVKINYKSFFEDCLNFASYINFNKYETIGIIGDYEYVNYIAIFGTLIAGKTYVPINQNLHFCYVLTTCRNIDQKIQSNSELRFLRFFSHGCVSALSAEGLVSAGTSSMRMKSLASSDTFAHRRPSIVKTPFLILVKISASLSPANGGEPESSM